MILFKVRVIFLRILSNVIIFLENWNTTDMGSLLTFNMFVLNSENRVKNNYHIYILNWILGKTKKRKRGFFPQ